MFGTSEHVTVYKVILLVILLVSFGMSSQCFRCSRMELIAWGDGTCARFCRNCLLLHDSAANILRWIRENAASASAHTMLFARKRLVWSSWNEASELFFAAVSGFVKESDFRADGILEHVLLNHPSPIPAFHARAIHHVEVALPDDALRIHFMTDLDAFTSVLRYRNPREESALSLIRDEVSENTLHSRIQLEFLVLLRNRWTSCREYLDTFEVLRLALPAKEAELRQDLRERLKMLRDALQVTVLAQVVLEYLS